MLIMGGFVKLELGVATHVEVYSTLKLKKTVLRLEEVEGMTTRTTSMWGV